jgi:hypothetical protein
MAIEMLNYADLTARLQVSPEAARALAKRLRLPRSRGNDGKALVSIDLAEINHAPLPARSPAGHQVVTPLRAKIETLQAELAKLEAMAGGSPGGLRVGARPKGQADGRVPEDDRHHNDSKGSHGSARGRASSPEGAAVVAPACRVRSSPSVEAVVANPTNAQVG